MYNWDGRQTGRESTVIRRSLIIVTAVVVIALAGLGADQLFATRAHRGVPVPPGSALASRTGKTISGQHDVTIVAQAIGSSVKVYREPTDPVPLMTLQSPQPFGAPQVFVVLQAVPNWLRVLLPVRPNGSTGWIRSRDVKLSWHTYRLVVELRSHLLIVYHGGVVIESDPAGIGTRETPTPSGTYFTKELIRTPNPDGPYGPYAYELSGFSTVLTHFAGGDGLIGIHGTNEPQYLGQDVSHGCIRISNAAITRLAHLLPLGVPVDIRDV
jgi:lipoprotein-anchoring transpeptidase ErfK/SrfK